MAEGPDNINEGVNVGGELVTDVRFTDNQGMVAETGITENNGQFK